MAEKLVELPIDHFRLLGVGPSVAADAALRALELRLDREPDKGFTREALTKRAELLRLSADLLTDPQRREQYETSLLEGLVGIDVDPNNEVAGLILLWEANSSYEAFKLASQKLQPPQSPALGSGREADLALVASLACVDAAQQEQELRHYELAASVLSEGLQLLQRMGKLPDQRRQIELDLQELLPYRILDLLSRDLSDQVSHQEGLRLLDNFVARRGGLEGRRVTAQKGGLAQQEFELFFQQIRKFLTVQEQVDLFDRWRKIGSADAGFLCVIALTAEGFSCRKPERIFEARRRLEKLNIPDLDPYPLLGSLDLLLANVAFAEERFGKSNDEGLTKWLTNYSGETLAALCEYSRDWLRRDVLPGYRDIDPDNVNLEAWFADRDVQAFVERIERNKGNLGSVKEKAFSFLSSLGPDQVSEQETKVEDNIQIKEVKEDSEYESKKTNISEGFLRSSAILKLSIFLKEIKNFSFTSLKPVEKKLILGSSFLLALLAAAVSFNFLIPQTRRIANTFSLNIKQVDRVSDLDEGPVDQVRNDDGIQENVENKKQENYLPPSWAITPLMADQPTELQLRNLLEAWLASKAAILAGGSNDVLPNVARKALVKRVIEERKKDRSRGELQKVQTNITSLKVISRKPSRIELKAKLAYRDKRLNSSGEVIVETVFPSLKVTYIFGKDGNYWRLHDYISGS